MLAIKKNKRQKSSLTILSLYKVGEKDYPMRKFIFAGLFASIFFIPAVAQENPVGTSQGAASVGAASEVGVSFGGVSAASLALAAALITALLAVMVEDNSATTSTSGTN